MRTEKENNQICIDMLNQWVGVINKFSPSDITYILVLNDSKDKGKIECKTKTKLNHVFTQEIAFDYFQPLHELMYAIKYVYTFMQNNEWHKK